MKAVLDGKRHTEFYQRECDERYAFDVTERNGFFRLNVLDLDNWERIVWGDIRFNNLLVKNDELYWFKCWTGSYPYDGVAVERIGFLEK